MSSKPLDPPFDPRIIPRFYEVVRAQDTYYDVFEPDLLPTYIGAYLAYDLLREPKPRKAAVTIADVAKQVLISSGVVKPAARPKRKHALAPLPVTIDMPGASGPIRLGLKYHIRYADARIPISRDPARHDKFLYHLDEWYQVARNAKDVEEHLATFRRVADAPDDNAAEMRICGFPFGRELVSMSPEVREKFAKALAQIDYTPADVPPDSPVTLYDKEGAYMVTAGYYFKKFLAETCTYDRKGNYYRKWQDHALKDPDRLFSPGNLRATYLEHSLQELELPRDRYYALLITPFVQRLYELSEARSGRLKVTPIHALGDDGRLEEEPDTFIEAGKLIFFYAYHGHDERQLRGNKFQLYPITKQNQGAYLRLADPQADVKRLLGDAAFDELRKHRRPRDEFDWFVELAALKFRDPMYTIDIAAARRQVYRDGNSIEDFLPSYRKQVLQQLEDKWLAWAGDDEGRLTLVEVARRHYAADDNLLPVEQGLMVAKNLKFVGCDADWAYLRDLEHDTTVKMPHAALAGQLAANHAGQILFESSRAIDWMIKIVVWGGVGAMAFGVGALSVELVNRIILRRLRKAAQDELVKQVIIYEIPALAAFLASNVARLFKDEVWQAYFAGFLEGYTTLTLRKVFFQMTEDGFAKAVLREYRLFKSLKALHKRVDLLVEKVEELRGKLDEEKLRRLVDNFTKGCDEVVRGMMLALSCVAFLDHTEGDGVLDGLHQLTGEPPMDPISRTDWYKEHRDLAVGMVSKLGDDLLLQGSSTAKGASAVVGFILEGGEKFAVVAVAVAAVKLARDLQTVDHSNNRKASVKKMAIVAGGLMLGIGALHIATDGESTNVMRTVAMETVTTLAPGDKTTARLKGRLVGNFVSSLLFDHGLLGSQSGLGQLAKRDKMARRFRKQLRHGVLLPLLRVLLGRYVGAYHRLLGGKGSEGDLQKLVRDFAHWRTDDASLEKFEEFRARTDTGFTLQDLADSLLMADRFLSEEVRARWETRWGGAIDTYKADLELFKNDAERLGLDVLMRDHAPVIGYTFLATLHAAVRQLREALVHFGATVGVLDSDGTALSVLRVFEMLGIEMEDIDKLEHMFDEETKQWASEYRVAR